MKNPTVISFFNNKGGVGKTTACINLASHYANDYKVLLIDNDPQGNLSESIGIEPDAEIVKAYNNEKVDFISVDFSQTLDDYELSSRKKIKKDLWILTGGLEMNKIINALEHKPAREKILAKHLLPQIIEQDFDYVFIDNSPSLSVFVWNSLCMSDQVIIPYKPSKYELRGIDNLLTILDTVKTELNHEIDILGILINMYQNNRLVAYYVNLIKEKFEEDKLFNTAISHTTAYGQAALACLPVDLYLPPSNEYNSTFKDIKEEIDLRLNKLTRSIR